jgi:hypothetical protein
MLTSARFLALFLGALSAALPFAHLLEMPRRMGYEGALWATVTVERGTYALFAMVGAPVQIGAIIAAFALAALERRGRAFGPVLAGAVLYAAAMAAWWAVVFPANQRFKGWTAGALPADWAWWRARWEYGHAAIAVLTMAGLAALIVGVVRGSGDRAK